METATPEQAATLAHRASRRGDVARPWWWFSEEAQTSNMLTPQVSMLEDGHRSGGDQVTPSTTMFAAVDEWRPLSVVSSTGLTTVTLAKKVYDDTIEPIKFVDGITAAVPHNRAFTASIYFTRPVGNQDSSFRVQEIDQTGKVVKPHYAVCRTDDALTRLSITAVTQPTTAALRIQAFKALAIADPCLTLTDRPLPFAVGGGASRVVVHSHSHAVQRATTDAWDRRSAWDYQIMEVG